MGYNAAALGLVAVIAPGHADGDNDGNYADCEEDPSYQAKDKSCPGLDFIIIIHDAYSGESNKNSKAQSASTTRLIRLGIVQFNLDRLQLLA